MKKYWKKIEAWFGENEPEILKTFNEGATEEQFKELENVLGFELPLDFREFYSVHNGQDTGAVFGSAIIDPDSEGLSSVQRIIDTYKMYQSIAEYATDVSDDDVEDGIKPMYWNDKWLPIMEDGMGNSYFIDLDPDENGRKGQIILRYNEGPTYELVAPSLEKWVKEFIEGNLD